MEKKELRFILGRGRMLWTALVGVLLLSGCLQKPVVDYQPMSRAIPEGRLPKSIAVLPFQNLTDEPELEVLFRNNLYSRLSVLPFLDVELTAVDASVKAHHPDLNLPFDPVALGRRLGCDAVIMGEVQDFDRVFAAVYAHMSVTGVIEIWDTRTEECIWMDRIVHVNREGGLPLDVLGMSMVGVRSGLHLRESVKIELIDGLCRRLVERIPCSAEVARPAQTQKGMRYALQIGSFIDPQGADAAVSQTGGWGYPVFIRVASASGRRWHRVLIGPFEERERAIAIKEDLLARMGVETILVDIPMESGSHADDGIGEHPRGG